MEKIYKEEKTGKCLEIDTDYHYSDEPFPISEMIEFLIKAKSNMATHVKIGGLSDYDDHSSLEHVNIQPISLTEETDEECSAREKLIKDKLDEVEKRRLGAEILEYEGLKKKLGK